MLKFLILSGVIAASTGNFGRHHGWGWDEEDDTKPPNCDCTEKTFNASDSADLWKWKHEDWVVKHLQENNTLTSLRTEWEKKKQVCGTDGVTYANKCDFVNKAASNPGLGQRCHGPCPCGENSEEHHSYRNHEGSKPAICLNNGVTVHGKDELAEAMKNNPGVGKRCWGECSECVNDLKCPRRNHVRPESNQTAPNCACTTSTSLRFQRFLNTTCGKKFLEKKQVCGSNNVTYANKCDFKNRQASSAALGERCRGACPCDFKPKDQMGHFRRHRRDGFFKFMKESKPYCLNNGVTVYGFEAKREALEKDADLGVRCSGKCSECQTSPIRCPFDWVKAKEDKERARPHPPNCTCPQALDFGFGKRHRHELCGNDNKTYGNICELINNQTTDAHLGFRCLGKCPCKDAAAAFADELGDDDDFEANNTESAPLFRLMMETGVQSDSTEDVNGTRSEAIQDPEEIEQMNPSSEGDESENGAVREKREMGWNRHRGHRRHHRRHHRFPTCLTNGETVRGWRAVSRAFHSDTGFGIRCIGHCDDCSSNSRCPHFPSEKKQAEIKEKKVHQMKKMRNWWLENTVESPDSPPNCQCHSPNKVHNFGHHGKFQRRSFQACGTNNVTYDNWCDLVNAQAVNAGLGTRCWGACPCTAEKFNVSEEPDKNFTLCLTNGKTVYSFREKAAALSADPTLGVRCMNECSICQNNITCPRIFKPRNDSHSDKPFGDWKHQGWKHGEEFGKRHEWHASENKFGHGKPRNFMRLDWKPESRMDGSMDSFASRFEQPAFQYGKAFDFGFHDHHSWGQHKGWVGHGSDHRGWNHHRGWGKECFDQE